VSDIQKFNREDSMTRNPFDLSGHAALVTGGSKGIGKAIAAGLARAGADILITSRHADELQAAASEIRAEAAGRVETRVADMTDRAAVGALAEFATSTLGKVDILFNNAGSNAPQPVEAITDEAWDRIVELNLTSCVMLTRALVPGMKARSYGRIVYIASILGIVGAPDRTLYCATKGGLISLAHAQALELGRHGITVNCISPGPILTDLPRTMFKKEQLAVMADATALGRWGEPDEIAGPAVMLASAAGSYVTGANIVIDGGATIKAF
jgi:NAD(P)-dependent dehydrogenase (short-subunit alcohol dehydrogenase family)